MRICVLFGSPHRRGNTMRLVETYAEGAMQSGHNVDIFDVMRMDIHPCMGCMACKKRDSGGVQHDDMEKIYNAVKASGVLVFATPMYWWNFSGR